MKKSTLSVFMIGGTVAGTVGGTVGGTFSHGQRSLLKTRLSK